VVQAFAVGGNASSGTPQRAVSWRGYLDPRGITTAVPAPVEWEGFTETVSRVPWFVKK
jgi:hypothetical protein